MLVGSRKFLLIALFAALLIVLVNLVWWLNYQRTEEMLEHQLGRRLSALAQAATQVVPALDLELLIQGEIETYLRVVDQLDFIRATDSLAELFVLDDSYHLLASTDIEPDSIYFLKDLNGPYIDSIFFTPVPVTVLTPSYQTGQLRLRSAFAPLISEDGVITAVLGVEANVDYFDSLGELRTNLYFASGLSLLGGILLGVVFLWLQSRINSAEQKLFLAETHTHLGRMVAVVAHELKNPLMIIRGSAERMAKKTEMGEATYVVEEVDRLDQIVSGYLDFAKAGGSVLAGETPEKFNLTELAMGIRKHIDLRYVDQPPIWISEPSEAMIEVVGYRRSLRQVLLNLLMNAIEACTEAGRPVEIGIELSADQSKAVVKVSDHGPGLGRREVKELFTPFRTSKKTGSGLGLYLSRRIVMEMGGEIGIDSVPGKGTTVTIEIPIESDS